MPDASPFPTDPGVYLLHLSLDAPACIAVGQMGRFTLAPGWYGYVGSAWGPGGLQGRLAHHLRPVARPHWHIDFLRSVAVLCAVWHAPAGRAAEHEWALELLMTPGVSVPIPRFGASDCSCPAHLFHAEGCPVTPQGIQCGFDLQVTELRAHAR